MASRAESFTQPHSEAAADVPLLPEWAVIVAHPDDESVGAGGLLPRLREARFLYATDGAPRDLRDAAAAGFTTCRDYAAARRKERAAALASAGIDSGRIEDLGFADQEASLNMTELTRRIAARLEAWRPAGVLTHPYEGGHPDHDAVAFAVHAACRLLDHDGIVPPAILEMTSYHVRDGRLNASEFLPNGDGPVTTIELSEAERQFKRRLFDCYATQRQTLSWFPIERERFRAAPQYDFTRPPHDGPLFYEQFPWGMTGDCFRRLAAEALRQLGLD